MTPVTVVHPSDSGPASPGPLDQLRSRGEELVAVTFEPDVKITYYAPKFDGREMGCGDGIYWPDDVTIVAVPPERNKQWRCNFLMEICGDGGCIVGVRQDTCPGCGTNHLDLSPDGLDRVCGPNKGVCQASLRVYAAGCMIPEGIDATREPVAESHAEHLVNSMAGSAPPDRQALLLELSAGAAARSCRD